MPTAFAGTVDILARIMAPRNAASGGKEQIGYAIPPFEHVQPGDEGPGIGTDLC
jgi:hypothetical protein